MPARKPAAAAREDAVPAAATAGHVDPVDLTLLPGYGIRRLQQIAVAIFLQEAEGQGITPVQYATLQCVHDTPGVDQRTLAGAIGFDTSTTADVVDRLQARGWLERSVAPHDRRVRLVSITPAGRSALRDAQPAVQRAQQRILAPLAARDRASFMRMLATLVRENNDHSRAPRHTD